MQGWQSMRRLEAIVGLVAAVAGCAVTATLAVAISSGALPAEWPGALFFQAVGFTAYLAVGLGAALHAAETPASPVGVALLWLATLLLAAATALAFAGVDTVRYLSLAGPYLTPALALAALASVAALASSGHDSTSIEAR
jgi:hypothetical protein